jgi:hypothetical protein
MVPFITTAVRTSNHKRRDRIRNEIFGHEVRVQNSLNRIGRETTKMVCRHKENEQNKASESDVRKRDLCDDWTRWFTHGGKTARRRLERNRKATIVGRQILGISYIDLYKT